MRDATLSIVSALKKDGARRGVFAEGMMASAGRATKIRATLTNEIIRRCEDERWRFESNLVVSSASGKATAGQRNIAPHFPRLFSQYPIVLPFQRR